jgi:hypothetical protein
VAEVQKCLLCKFFLKSRIIDTKQGECRRFPKGVLKNQESWCGEFIIAPEFVPEVVP